MIRHFIIMSNSDLLKKRIALHYILDEKLDVSLIKKEMKTIKEKCDQATSFSTHWIVTNSEEWKSVGEKDFFFVGVQEVKELSTFIKLISANK